MKRREGGQEGETQGCKSELEEGREEFVLLVWRTETEREVKGDGLIDINTGPQPSHIRCNIWEKHQEKDGNNKSHTQPAPVFSELSLPHSINQTHLSGKARFIISH